MPANSSDVKHADVRRDGDVLVFAGALRRDGVAGLWAQAAKMIAGARRIDLSAVDDVDSAGLALLAELAARGDNVAIVGTPPGLDELRAAYRLDARLGYAA